MTRLRADLAKQITIDGEVSANTQQFQGGISEKQNRHEGTICCDNSLSNIGWKSPAVCRWSRFSIKESCWMDSSRRFCLSG
jgi:hypothetical protein